MKLTQPACITTTLLLGALGAASTIGWAPFGWWSLPLICYAALFYLLCRTTKTIDAALIGWAFGLGLHLTGHGWMYTALHSKTGMAIGMAAASTLFYLLYLATFTALPCALYKYVTKHQNSTSIRIHHAVLLAALLTLGEWARSLLFNGFTSLSLGYSLIDTCLAGYAPVAGLYGVSFVGFCLAHCLTLLVTKITAITSMRTAIRISMLMLVLTLTGWMLQKVEWVHALGQPLHYRLIQTNVAQGRKFDPLYAKQQAQHVTDLITQAPADLIVTPETVFTTFFNDLPNETLANMQQFSQRTSSHVFLGIATTAANSDGYNSIVHITPNSFAMPQYNKVRLMPFGEYSPVGFGWFTDLLHIPLKDMSAGQETQPPFVIHKHGTTWQIGSLICHEDGLGSEARRRAENANLLLNPGNLAWFEGSLAIEQALQIARMRALEVGRPILRVGNAGITAHIDARGNVVQQLAADQENILRGNVQATSGETLYTRMGDGVVVMLCVFVIIMSVLVRRKH